MADNGVHSGNRRAVTSSTYHREKMATLGELTAGIAHELNNPIGYIASNLNTLAKYAESLVELIDASPEGMAPAARAAWDERLATARWSFVRQDLRDLIEETRTGANLLKDVVSDLKALCRSGSSAEWVSVDACIRSALGVLAHHLKHQVAIEVRLAAAQPMAMVRSQIIQLVINLIHNALQAIGREKGAMRITTSQSEGRVTCAVEDSGPGVPADLCATIFTAYFTTKPSGTGLGLAIVKQIAEAHGGSAACGTSGDLGGAKFVITLCGLPASESRR
jgi:two-component system, NtrC family, sensor kinase